MTQNRAGAHVFQLSEFVVASELSFDFAHTPPARVGSSGPPTVDLRIELGATPERLAAPSFSTGQWQLEHDRRFLLTAPGIGRFLLERDGAVRIEPFCEPDRVELRLYFLGTVFAAWLAMRGFVPLHAGAVETGRGAALICGRSGAGKSTTMALLARAGRPVLAEDLSILKIGEGVEILAFSGQVKLDASVVEALGLDSAAQTVIRTPRRKYAVPVPRTTGRRAVTQALVLHPPGQALAPPGATHGASAVRTLMNQVFRPRIVSHIMGRADLMARMARLADAVELFHIHRRADYALPEGMDALLDAGEAERR